MQKLNKVDSLGTKYHIEPESFRFVRHDHVIKDNFVSDLKPIEKKFYVEDPEIANMFPEDAEEIRFVSELETEFYLFYLGSSSKKVCV